jgi:hypothetical protein
MRTIASKAFRSESLSVVFSDDVEPDSAGSKSNSSGCFSGCCSRVSALGTAGDEEPDFSEFSDDDVESDDVEPDSATGKSSASGCIASASCPGVFSSGTVGDDELDSSVSLLSRAAFNCIPMVVAILRS